MKILSLEHGPVESACRIRDWALDRKHDFAVVRLDLNEPLPALMDFDFLVIMGGGMNIYQHRDYPWLIAEKRLIANAIAADKTVLGVCLGAQLIADVLGGKVMQNPQKEIGWMPVHFHDRTTPFDGFPADCMAFHWHGDTFSLPPDTRSVASSAATEKQAFIHGDRVVGLQFHIEVTHAAADEFCVGADHELQPAPYVQTRQQINAQRPDLAPAEGGLFRLLDHLASGGGASAI
jgi:GMP synthase-like glutamine amidotransferase